VRAEEDGLICAYRLDGAGGAAALGWADLDPLRGGPLRGGAGVLWVHLDRTVPRAQAWLVGESGLDAIVRESLLAEDTRPRATVYGAGLMLNLRGVNLNPGAEPEDMLSARLWVEPGLVVSTRRHPILAIRDVREALEAGRGPAGEGGLVTLLAGRLIERMGPVLHAMDERLDGLEEAVLQPAEARLRAELRELRREAIQLRRYIGPQREALAALARADLAWLAAADRHRLAESIDRVTRHVEDLDAVRERAAVVNDELVGALSERMNRTMYLLTVVAAFFLPLGFLTGLLGINVAGLPGTETPYAFWAVCAGLAVLCGVELWVLRRLRWI